MGLVIEDLEELIPLSRAAEKLNVSVDTVRRLVLKGDIPAMKIGGAWRTTERWIMEYVHQSYAKRYRVFDGMPLNGCDDE